MSHRSHCQTNRNSLQNVNPKYRGKENPLICWQPKKTLIWITANKQSARIRRFHPRVNKFILPLNTTPTPSRTEGIASTAHTHSEKRVAFMLVSEVRHGHSAATAVSFHHVILQVVAAVKQLAAYVARYVVLAGALLAVAAEARRVPVLLAAVVAREAQSRISRHLAQAIVKAIECWKHGNNTAVS